MLPMTPRDWVKLILILVLAAAAVVAITLLAVTGHGPFLRGTA